MPQPGITFRTIGGLLDFSGPEPETVEQQYTGLIRRTFMPPYFALGFQLIRRWGYKNTEDIRQVIELTKSFDIPQILKLQKLQSD
jgi:alpha-glucosidase (family GH31 glycosyl hydrolase)